MQKKNLNSILKLILLNDDVNQLKICRANVEIDKLRKSTAGELQGLKAELRKSEIKISSLELTVKQKVCFCFYIYL